VRILAHPEGKEGHMKRLSPYEENAVACLTTRARWCIVNQLGIDPSDEPRAAAEALTKLTRWELLRWPNFGQKSLKEVELFLRYFEDTQLLSERIQAIVPKAPEPVISFLVKLERSYEALAEAEKAMNEIAKNDEEGEYTLEHRATRAAELAHAWRLRYARL